jgi:hypothetical protein
MAGDKNQIVGVMRFSYISKGGFAHSHDSQEDQERMIYAADRMERRFQLFEDFALRALKYQTDQNFKCIVLVTQTFPKPFRDRLEDLMAGWPAGQIVAKPFMPQFRAIKACYDEAQDPSCDWLTSFRLDDDDMLDFRFIERVKARAVKLAKVKDDGQPVVMSFNRGLYLKIGQQKNHIFDAVERTPLSVGAAMITPAGAQANIYSRNHRKLPAFFTTYSDVDEASWLRTIHQDNDSNPEFTGETKLLDTAEVDVQLREGFGLKRSDLMAWGR